MHRRSRRLGAVHYAGLMPSIHDLVWWDFRSAVVLTVIVPLLLLLCARAIPHLFRLLVTYWRVSSLLAITVYLMIGGLPLSFLTGTAARVLIIGALWFWRGLSVAIELDPSWPCRLFRVWRWLITVYMALGACFSGTYLPCAFQEPLASSCTVWFAPPLAYREIFHPQLDQHLLGGLGLVGLVAYLIILAIFIQQKQQESKA